MGKVLKPKSRKYYYVSLVAIVILSVVLTDTKWVNEVLFGMIVLSSLVYISRKLIKKPVVAYFAFETQYDKLSSILSILSGIGMITMSITNSDFMNRLNLEWINFLIIGICFILSGISNRKSLIFLLKSPELIEVENYELSIHSKTQEISFTSNQITVINEEGENYLFNELNLSQEITHKFSDWIKTNMDKSDISIQWTE